MQQRIPAWMIGLVAGGMLAACGGSADSGGTAARQLAARSMATTAVASSFGVTAANGLLTVDTGAGLVFQVRQSNGDISSIRYKGGPQLQDQAKGSHIASGLGSTGTTVSYTVDNGIAKITLATATLTHYLLVRQGENTIYMGTYTTAEPSIGELRWITRLNGSILTSVPPESNNLNNTGAIESSDVFGYADGTTTSKYYGNQRAMDMTIRGVTSPAYNFGVFMAYGNRETSSGGPFYRDIQNQSGGDSEVYTYMNSGHAQTEAWRMGFHGPYALVFSDGMGTPAVPDMAWIDGQNLLGQVPASQRGKVVGRGLYGFDLTDQFTVGFSNSTAQYWAKVNAPNGNFTTPPMQPGTYTMTVYKGELAVYTEQNVVVTSGATNTLAPRTLTGDLNKTAALWRIGKWDGTPLEFLNGPSINVRHPSDSRNAPWAPGSYAVGAPFNTFPAAEWKTGVNNGQVVTFNLTPDQVASHTIRIGITTAIAGGRPQIKVNGWTSGIPSPSSQPSSRTLTTGNYRGNNTLFTYNVPATAFVAGTNTLTINVVSGSSGATYLSPGYAFDALDML